MRLFFCLLLIAMFMVYCIEGQKLTKKEKKAAKKAAKLEKKTNKLLKKVVLKDHNKLRKTHSVKGLKWDKKLAKKAAKLCKKLATKKSSFKDSEAQGLNLYTKKTKVKSAIKKVTDTWYSKEEALYAGVTNYTTETTSLQELDDGGYGHFTQLVWKATKKVGCGYGEGDKNRVFICCQYSPEGNVLNKFLKNVQEPEKSRSLLVSGEDLERKQSDDEEESEKKKKKKEKKQKKKNKKFLKKVVLKDHNEFREKHGVNDLKWNKKLAKSSTKFCEKLARENKFEHSNDKGGENLYRTTNTNLRDSIKKVTDAWYTKEEALYSEITKYTKETNSFQDFNDGGYGHFTQLVWKATKTVGCGYGENDETNKVLICCQYLPGGNYIGDFLENVLKP